MTNIYDYMDGPTAAELRQADLERRAEAEKRQTIFWRWRPSVSARKIVTLPRGSTRQTLSLVPAMG